jgi:hypothetical protein
MVVAKDILATYPPTAAPGLSGVSLISRTGPLKAESSLASEDDIGRIGRDIKEGSKTDFVAKVDNNADNLFIEDVSRLFAFFLRPVLLNVASGLRTF